MKAKLNYIAPLALVLLAACGSAAPAVHPAVQVSRSPSAIPCPQYTTCPPLPPAVRRAMASRAAALQKSNAAGSAASASPTSKAAHPAPTHPAAPPPPPTPKPAYTPPPPPPAPAGCYPKTDGGNCYEPGEYCRESDHGASGIAGDGAAITCEDNDGWRWEPS